MTWSDSWLDQRDLIEERKSRDQFFVYLAKKTLCFCCGYTCLAVKFEVQVNFIKCKRTFRSISFVRPQWVESASYPSVVEDIIRRKRSVKKAKSIPKGRSLYLAFLKMRSWRRLRSPRYRESFRLLEVILVSAKNTFPAVMSCTHVMMQLPVGKSYFCC